VPIAESDGGSGVSWVVCSFDGDDLLDACLLAGDIEKYVVIALIARNGRNAPLKTHALGRWSLCRIDIPCTLQGHVQVPLEVLQFVQVSAFGP